MLNNVETCHCEADIFFDVLSSPSLDAPYVRWSHTQMKDCNPPL